MILLIYLEGKYPRIIDILFDKGIKGIWAKIEVLIQAVSPQGLIDLHLYSRWRSTTLSGLLFPGKSSSRCAPGNTIIVRPLRNPKTRQSLRPRDPPKELLDVHNCTWELHCLVLDFVKEITISFAS